MHYRGDSLLPESLIVTLALFVAPITVLSGEISSTSNVSSASSRWSWMISICQLLFDIPSQTHRETAIFFCFSRWGSTPHIPTNCSKSRTKYFRSFWCSIHKWLYWLPFKFNSINLKLNSFVQTALNVYSFAREEIKQSQFCNNLFIFYDSNPSPVKAELQTTHMVTSEDGQGHYYWESFLYLLKAYCNKTCIVIITKITELQIRI